METRAIHYATVRVTDQKKRVGRDWTQSGVKKCFHPDCGSYGTYDGCASEFTSNPLDCALDLNHTVFAPLRFGGSAEPKPRDFVTTLSIDLRVADRTNARFKRLVEPRGNLQ